MDEETKATPISAATAAPADEKQVLPNSSDKVPAALLTDSFALTEQGTDTAQVVEKVVAKPSAYRDFSGLSEEDADAIGKSVAPFIGAQLKAHGTVTPNSFSKADIRRYNMRPEVPTVSEMLEIKENALNVKSLFAKSKISKGDFITQFPVDLLYDPFERVITDIRTRAHVSDPTLVQQLASILATNGTNWPQAGGLVILPDVLNPDVDLAFAGSVSNASSMSDQINPMLASFIKEAKPLFNEAGIVGADETKLFTAMVIHLQATYIRLLGPHVNAKRVSYATLPIWMLIASRDIEAGQEICRAIDLPAVLRFFSPLIATFVKQLLDLPFIQEAVQKLVDN